jgi:hypothetical protein
MDKDEACNDKALSGLDPIDASIDVYGIGAEDSKHAHVDVIKNAEVEHAAEEGSQELRNNHAGKTAIGYK